MKLQSERLSADDYDAAIELFYERHWTDGLPVVLPTPRRVEGLIEHVGRDPQESLGRIPPKGGEATIEKLAVNAVMGGCRPADFPVVLAAIEAMLDPAHNLNGVLQTTHMCVSLVIVNGPLARTLGMNSRDGVFGNGYRANAAIGRGVRLALWNLGDAFPWDTDIVWDNFENAARTQARIQDVADLALVVIPHRKGGETADDQRRKAEHALPIVVAGLIQI